MVVNFDFDAFFDELKATKPPYKCPFKDCEKIYKTYSGIQYHVVTQHKQNNKPAKWHHRQMRCPITPPKSVSSAEAASEGEVELVGDGEGKLEIEFGETKFYFNDFDNLEIEIISPKDSNLESESINGILSSNQLHCSMNKAEQILKEEPKKPLPVSIFSKLPKSPSSSDEFTMPNEYITTISKDESQANKLEYLLDEEDKTWLKKMSEKFGDLKGVDEMRFELAMETMEKASAFVTRCENRNHANVNNAACDDETMQDDNAVCSVCGDGSCHASNAILFCDMCDMAVHQECYGVPYVPEGQWLCRRCLHSPSKTAQCCLCPCPGGALKQTSDGRWAHVLCSAWVPEVNFANPVFLEPIEGLENIPPARWRLVCFLCRRRKVGACIQCHRPNCYTAFHVSCALFAGLHLEMTQRGVDNGPRGIFIPGHSSGNVRKTAFCDQHAPKPGKNKSIKRDDAACDPASDDGGNESDACEQIDEGRKLLAGDDEGDDDYDPGSLGRSRTDAVTKSRSVMNRVVTSKMKRIVGVLSYPTVSKESFAKVSQIFEMNCDDDFLRRLKNYWTLKRLSRNGVPLVRGLQPNLVPKVQANQERTEEEEEPMDDNEEEEEEDIGSTTSYNKTNRSGQRLCKDTKDEDDTVMLSLTCVNDDEEDNDNDDDDDDDDDDVDEEIKVEKHDDENNVCDEEEEMLEASSQFEFSCADDDPEVNVGSRKRKLASQDVSNKRLKLIGQVDDPLSASRSKKSGSFSRRLRFYGDPGSSDAPQEVMPDDMSQGEMHSMECNRDNVKRSKRTRKMSSALFDYTYFGSVQRRRSNKSEEEKSNKADNSLSSVTDDSFSKETEEIQKKKSTLKIKNLIETKPNNENKSLFENSSFDQTSTRRGRKKKIKPDRDSPSPSVELLTSHDEPEDDLCGAKHLREDLSKVKKILEFVTQREECKLEEVKVKTRMYSLKLDPLTPILTRALDLLQEKDNHEFFAEPVDIDEVADYLDFISRPMDFTTMRGKIERHEYQNVASFEADLELIITNCMTYNSSGTIYYNAATRLRNQGKSILNEARKTEEQMNSLKKLNSTTSCDDGDDSTTNKTNAESDPRRRGREGTSIEDHLASIRARIESVERKLDSSSGFLRETYSRQLKHLNRQMAALRGRRRKGNSESTTGTVSEMPILANEDMGQNKAHHLDASTVEPLALTENGDGANEQTAPSPSPSSSSFSSSPPSLSPQVVAVTPSPISSATPPPILSANTLPASSPHQPQLSDDRAEEFFADVISVDVCDPRMVENVIIAGTSSANIKFSDSNQTQHSDQQVEQGTTNFAGSSPPSDGDDLSHIEIARMADEP